MDQELTLKQAIGCFRLAANYEEYKEGLREMLTQCHTNKQLEQVKPIIEQEKHRLITENPEFKAIMDARLRENKIRNEQERAEHLARAAKAGTSRKSAKMLDPDIDEWVAKTRVKIVAPEELEKKLDDKLGCPNPKCEDHGKNRGNTINNILTCMRCRHKLIPKSEFKNHNRAYWRRFNKKRKKKGKTKNRSQ